MQQHQSEYLDYFCRDFTSLAGTAPVVFFIILSTTTLILLQQYHLALINIAFYIGSAISVGWMKEKTGRWGPLPYDPWHTGMADDLIQIQGVKHFHAFPSGHTCNSLVLFLTTAILLGHVLPECNLFFIITALLTSLTIGIGKMYLGAHWLSDVIAGYALALIYVYLWSLVI